MPTSLCSVVLLASHILPYHSICLAATGGTKRKAASTSEDHASSETQRELPVAAFIHHPRPGLRAANILGNEEYAH
ncbi:hypothetical protein K440DRAFT_613974 [Wilcoxina mikolae CBS 423.85]|nr:hypothetical protein K440DRAFT_613974 [Wilcoxina mikolae CBS 423.85]